MGSILTRNTIFVKATVLLNALLKSRHENHVKYTCWENQMPLYKIPSRRNILTHFVLPLHIYRVKSISQIKLCCSDASKVLRLYYQNESRIHFVCVQFTHLLRNFNVDDRLLVRCSVLVQPHVAELIVHCAALLVFREQTLGA
jgi:hypothetical protein